MAKKRGSHRRALTEEERAEKRAAERELVAKAIEELRSSEGWQRWLSVRRRFHRYSLRNQLLIALQRPEASYVTGFPRQLHDCFDPGVRRVNRWANGPYTVYRAEYRRIHPDAARLSPTRNRY